MTTPYEKFKGFAITVLLGIIAYTILNAVRLAERLVEAKELEARYEVFHDIPYLIDKKERKIYVWNSEKEQYEIAK